MYGSTKINKDFFKKKLIDLCRETSQFHKLKSRMLPGPKFLDYKALPKYFYFSNWKGESAKNQILSGLKKKILKHGNLRWMLLSACLVVNSSVHFDCHMHCMSVTASFLAGKGKLLPGV